MKDAFPDNTIRFIDLRGTGFSHAEKNWQVKIHDAMLDILQDMKGLELKEPVLLKPHIGEPKGTTFIIPQTSTAVMEFLRERKIKRTACGDSTVAYSGERGHKENPLNDFTRYLKLAAQRGWDAKGPLGTPFVILDRPATSARGIYEFANEEVFLKGDFGRYREIRGAGGYQTAGAIINIAHMTLHPVAHFACAIKNIAMGGASYKGKLQMHQHYLPEINKDKCLQCGECSAHCPAEALKWVAGDYPKLDAKSCIGCGECLSVCNEQGQAITMETARIADWMRGEDTMQNRLMDYAVGLIGNRWGNLLNIAHLYNITQNCDCFDIVQKPIFNDIGILIGMNPFAIDFYARYLISNEMWKTKNKNELTYNEFVKGPNLLKQYFKDDAGAAPYEYLKKQYGIQYEAGEIKTYLCKTVASGQ